MCKKTFLFFMIILLTISLSSCVVTDAVFNILGIDSKDYTNEEKISDISLEDDVVQTLLRITEVLTYCNSDILCFDADVGEDCYETVLNYLGGKYYSKYSADDDMFQKLAENYPEYEVNTLIPEGDFENAMYRFFGGKRKVKNQSVGLYIYLEKMNAYLYTSKTKSPQISSEALSVYETKNTYHADIKFYSDRAEAESYHVIFIKREKADPYLFRVVQNLKIEI